MLSLVLLFMRQLITNGMHNLTAKLFVGTSLKDKHDLNNV